MKIYNSISFDNLVLQLKDINIKEGSIIHGKIVEINDDEVILNLGNIGTIRVEAEVNVDNLKDQSVKFLVKNIGNNRIELVPLFDKQDVEKVSNNVDKDNKEVIGEILKKFNILEDDISEKMIEVLFKYNIPINKENVIGSLKSIDKLEDIYNKDEEKIILLNGDEDPIKTDIKNFLLVDKNEYPEKEDLKFIYDDIRYIIHEGNKNSDLFKAIAFLIKNKMNISINNLKCLFMLMKNEKLISEDILNIVDAHEKLDKPNSKSENKIEIIFSDKDSQVFKNYYKDINRKLEDLNNFIKKEDLQVTKSKEEGLKENIKELSNKIEFLNELNNEMTFLYMPILIENDKNKGSVSIFKKGKRNIEKNEKFNIFINLHMEYLENVKIFCEIVNELINITVNIKQDNVILFKSNEYKLINILKDKGFKLTNITYIVDDKINFLDTLVDNANPYYFLDVRV